MQIRVQAGTVEVKFRPAKAQCLAHHRVSVRQTGPLGDKVDHIHTEAVNALVQPPVDHLINIMAYRRILPIQVHLLFGKGVHSPTVHRFIIIPGRTGEQALPVVRRGVAAVVPAPNIILMVLIMPVLLGGLKPGVLVRSMVHHQVHDQPHAPLMDLTKQTVKIRHGAKVVHNIVVVGNIVAIIVIWAFVHGAAPNAVHPQVLKIIQLFDNAVNVADTVAVGILKRARINLVKHSLFPPLWRNGTVVRRNNGVALAVQQIAEHLHRALFDHAAGKWAECFHFQLRQCGALKIFRLKAEVQQHFFQ